MDSETAFAAIYWAVTWLTGKALKAADVPNAFLPTLVLRYHSIHARSLFLAIRAYRKYHGWTHELRDILTRMDDFADRIDTAVRRSPVPDSPPGGTFAIIVQPEANRRFQAEYERFQAHVHFFVGVLDLLLDDLAQCLTQWHDVLRHIAEFRRTDRARNTFEAFGQGVLDRDWDLVEATNETRFDQALAQLGNHRNAYARLLGLPARLPLPRLRFGGWRGAKEVY